VEEAGSFNGSSAYITNIFDSSARLTNTTLFNSSNGELNKHEYLYNLANQRTNQVRTGGAYVKLASQARHELVSL
jgi:hypothetical protein